MKNRGLVGIALLGCVVLSVSLAPSQSPTGAKSEEYLLLGSPNRGAGEPFVFVNPKDDNNIIVAAMATLNHLPTGESPIPRGQPGSTEIRVKEFSVPDGSRTDIGVTRDGGKTWSIGEDNFRKFYNRNRCADSFAGAGPDGTLYVGCLAYINHGDADFDLGYGPDGSPRRRHGGSAIAWSKDKGVTWSNPVIVHPTEPQSPSLYPANVHPVFEQASPYDRPVFAADASTGTIYVSSSGLAYTVDPAAVPRPKVDPSLPGKGYTGFPPSSVTRGRTFMRASHDQGRTWGLIYPVDSDEYPGGRGGFSAAFGNLAVAYTAAKVPQSLNTQCPCTVFGTSRDDGKTFAYKIVPAVEGRGGAGEPGGGILFSADPSHEGTYALGRQSGPAILVTVTRDGGKTWSQPVVAAQVPGGVRFGHRAMKYSAQGDLALIWKATYPGGETYGTNSQKIGRFDVWSSLSRDGGNVFKTVRVSHEVSPPYILERSNFLFGDDLSSVDVDDQYVHVVWGDNRTGFLGTWYGRVPLSAY